jgi:hypothetical protein
MWYIDKLRSIYLHHVQTKVHEREKYASLTMARATCDLLAEGVIRYSIFSSELGTGALWDWC